MPGSTISSKSSRRAAAIARHEQDRQHLVEVSGVYVRDLQAAQAARRAAALPRGLLYFQGVRIDAAAAHFVRVWRCALRDNCYRLPARLILLVWATWLVGIFAAVVLGAVEAEAKAKGGEDPAWWLPLPRGVLMGSMGATLLVFSVFPPLHANVKEIFARA